MEKIYFFAAFTLIFSGITAQPGSLDRSFSHDDIGRYDFHINALSEEGKTVLTLPHGKKIVVFTSNGYTKLTRLQRDGETDFSFGRKGFSAAVNFDAINAILVKNDKIVVAGLSDSGSGIARFNADGRLDRTFHHNGLLEGIDFSITDLADYHQGKFVVAGEKNNEPGLVVARYLPDGTADPSFGNGGRTILDVQNHSSYGWRAFIAVQPDGKIMTAVTINIGFSSSPSGFEIVRLNRNGSIDGDFGDVGKLIAPLENCQLKALLLQPDGKIIAGGYFSYPSDLVMLRYNHDGSPDSSFGVNGKAIADLQPGLADLIDINSIALKPDGKILAAGSLYFYIDQTNNGYTLEVMQFKSNGSPDSSFHENGKLSFDIGIDIEEVNFVTSEKDGSIILCGRSNMRGPNFIYRDWDFVVCRLYSNGIPDEKFGERGVLIGYCPSNSTVFTNAIVQPDGKLLVAGELSNEMDTSFLMIRIFTNGLRDLTFGRKGFVISHTLSDRIGHRPYTLALATNGKILVTGIGHRYPGRIYRYNEFNIIRYLPDGKLDFDFGLGGYQNRLIGLSWHIFNTSILNDGNMVIAAYTDTIWGRDFSVVKVDPGGTIKSITLLGNLDYINTIAVQPDNKILVAGKRNVSGSGTDFSITRLNADGSLDLSFGIGGKLITSFNGNDDAITSLFIQPDGKIIAAGYSRNPVSDKSDFAIIRYNANGSLDAGFDQDGKQLVDFYGGMASVNSITLEPDGKIILGGTSGNITGTVKNHHDFKLSAFAIARLQDNGFVDKSFGKNGRVLTNTGPGPDILSMVLISGNKLYAAGINTDRFDFGSSQGIISVYHLSGIDMRESNTTEVVKVTGEINKQLFIRAFPNPSTNYFMVTIRSSSSHRPVSFRVIDAVGRIMEERTGISADQTFQIGSSYQPGIYFIRVIYDGQPEQLKLVKLSN